MTMTEELTVPQFTPIIVPPSGMPALLAQMTAHIVGIQLATNPTGKDDIPALFRMVHQELASIAGAEPAPSSPVPRPDLPQEALAEGQIDAARWPGVFDDRIVCLEDGRSVTLLKSYVAKRHGMSLLEYQRKWRLPSDYPSVPPEYVERKRAIAHSNGLGTTVKWDRGKAKDAA